MISLLLLQSTAPQTAQFLDGGGQCGSFVHYAFILAFVGSAFIIFLYLWRKDKLDMDEEPKITMMNGDAGDDGKDEGESGSGGSHGEQ